MLLIIPDSHRVHHSTFHMVTSSNGNIFRVTALWAGNSPVTGEFPSQNPVTQSFDISFDLGMNKRLSKQSRRWWIETPSRSLWLHCYKNMSLSRSVVLLPALGCSRWNSSLVLTSPVQPVCCHIRSDTCIPRKDIKLSTLVQITTVSSGCLNYLQTTKTDRRYFQHSTYGSPTRPVTSCNHDYALQNSVIIG